jgi:hypothetical protein
MALLGAMTKHPLALACLGMGATYLARMLSDEAGYGEVYTIQFL